MELTLATGSVRQPVGERDAFNDIIKSSHPATASSPCPALVLRTQVSDTHGRRWSPHNMSDPPAGRKNSTAARPCFWTLITDPPPLPPTPCALLHRTVHTSRGAAAQRAGLVLCAGELAPSAGAQRHHHRLQAPVQRQPQPAGALVGETLPGWWVSIPRASLTYSSLQY